MTDMEEVINRLAKIEMLMRISNKSALDVHECAAYLGLSASYIRHLASGHAIPHYKRNGKLFFSKKDMDDWMLSNRVSSDYEINEIANKCY